MKYKDLRIGAYYLIDPSKDGWGSPQKGIAKFLYKNPHAPVENNLAFQFIRHISETDEVGHDGFQKGEKGYCWNVGTKSVIKKATKKEIEIEKQKIIENEI